MILNDIVAENMSISANSLLTLPNTLTDGWFGNVLFIIIYVLFFAWSFRFGDTKTSLGGVTIIMFIIALIMDAIGIINTMFISFAGIAAAVGIVLIWLGD